MKKVTRAKVNHHLKFILSQGVENVFIAMDLNDSSRSLIVYMNLCTMKNMIKLSNLDVEDVSNLFSHKESYEWMTFILQKIVVDIEKDS